MEGALEGSLSRGEGWPFVVDNTCGAWEKGMERSLLQFVCIHRVDSMHRAHDPWLIQSLITPF